MRESELRAHTHCSVCGQPVGRSGPLLWTVRIEQHGIKIPTIRRQDALCAMLGGHARLAQVMGVDEEMTELMIGPIVVTICESCAVSEICLAQLALEGE